MRWTKDEVKKLVSEYSECVSLQNLSKKLGKSIKSVKHKAARLGLSRGKAPINKPKNTNSRKISEKKYYEKNKFRIYNNKVLRLKTKKEELINLLGGKCALCGYCKYCSALEFHHQKDKNCNVAKIIKNFSKEKALKEIENCILLCANCHRELHAES